MLEINIDLKEFTDFADHLPEKLKHELEIEMKNQLVLLQEEARQQHRYESHTRGLERSVQWKIEDDGMKGTVYLDEDIADYGKYVIGGHGTWDPDPFLETALEKREPEIREGFEKAVEKAIKE